MSTSTVLPVSAEESPSAETATTSTASTAAAASADNNNNIDNTNNAESSTVKQNSNLPEYVTNIDGSVAALMEEIPIQYAKRQTGFFSSVTVTPQNKESLTKAALLALIRLFPNENVRKRFLHKYIIARSGRIESAAERVLNFCEQLENYPHINEINLASEESKRLMNIGVMNAFPPRLCDKFDNAVMIGLVFRHLNWEKIGEVEAMQKFWLTYFITVVIMRSDHAAQFSGIVLQGDIRGIGPANIKIKLHLFILHMITRCLPIRFKSSYSYCAPAFINYTVFPVIKLALTQKLVDRIHFIEKDKEEELIKNVGKHNTFGVIMRSVDDKENATMRDEKKQEESSGTDEEGASSASASATSTAKTSDNKEKEEEYWFPERMPSEECWKEMLSWMQ